MKKFLYLFSFILLLLISTNALAKTPSTHLPQTSLSDQYLNQARDAYERKDDSGALELLRKAAQLDNAEANYLLGMVYFAPGIWKASFPGPDPDLAMKYMSRAAHLGDDKAKKMLISFQLQGFGNTPAEKVISLRSEYEAQARNSNVNRVNNTLDLISSYLGTKQKTLRNVSKAEYFINRSLELQLNKNQQYLLSLLCLMISIDYMWGYDGSQKNPQKSFKWMKAAADLGLKNAYYNLSDMYFYGYGTPINLKKSHEMTQLGDKLNWHPSDNRHKKHIYSFFFRPFVYSGWINKYNPENRT